MTLTQTNRGYSPDIAIHPGETLIENLEAMGMSQIELSIRTGLTPKTISEIIKGKNPITPSTALKLEATLGIDAHFWNNLQVNYDETVARLEREEKMNKEFTVAEKFTCYSELAKHGLVEDVPPRDIYRKTINLLKFFGVDSFDYLLNIQEIAFRRNVNTSVSSENLAAWLRWGEIKADKIETGEFNIEKIRLLIPKLRSLTLNPENFSTKLRNLCAECGIAVVFTPCLKNTKVNGATRWKAEKAIIQLSDRLKMSDVFWFTFFHELGHILKHGKKGEFIELQDKDDSEKEIEANDFARTTLIPDATYNEYFKEGNLSDKAIKFFADSVGVSSDIVAGRLAKDQKLSWQHIHHLRMHIEIKVPH